MKSYIVFLISFFLVLNATAQSTDDDLGCRDRVHHIHDFSRGQQANYLQYVSSMDKYDAKYLKLDISVEVTSRFISGTALTIVKAVQPLDSFITEFRSNMVVDSVFINGVKMNYFRADDHVFIPISPALPAGSMVNVLFYYNGTASSNAVFAGTNGQGLMYSASLSESYQAREWFPVKQILKDKFDSADIWITTSSPNMAGSNGLLKAVVSLPGGKVQYQWKTRYHENYYMPSFSVGNYQEYDNYAKPAAMAPDSILVQHYVFNDDNFLTSIKANLDKTPPFIEKFSELFGLYPFKNEKYGHSHANIGGGMEHQTMTTTSSFSSTIIAHELGHQWFGDNVTCAVWNDIWLNEGFASYCEYLAIENLPALFPTTDPATYMQNIHNDVLMSATGSVRVPDASVFDENRIFSSRFSYNKGSAIIHNLRFEMEDDNKFFQTLKNYQQQFKDSVATAEDFKHVAETTCSKDFTDFFNQWYYGEGYPTFNVTFLKQGANILTLIVNQTVSAPGITPFFKGLYEFKITSAQGDTTVKVYMSTNDQHFDFYNYSKTPNGVIVDPNNWVLNKTGTITNGGVVIPVTLISFEGSADGNCNAVLQWKTTNEQNILRYDLEYSEDGVHFIPAGEKAGTNTNVETDYSVNYSFGGSATHFFRLKIMDTDGSYTYSRVIQISDACTPPFKVDIAPNPVAGILFVTIAQPEAGKITITLFNQSGEVMYTDEKMLAAGKSSVQIKMQQKFAAGTYLLRVENAAGKIISKKVIKI